MRAHSSLCDRGSGMIECLCLTRAFLNPNRKLNCMRKITKAVVRDMKEVLALLEEVKLPVEGVVDYFHNFFVVREYHRLIGCAGT